MYAYIRGRVIARQADYIVVDNQGIGYRIQAAPALIERFPARGEEGTFYTYLYVREDTQALFGFPTSEELHMFELLLTVSGIGPKIASAIVGTLSPSQFALAIITGDIKVLTSVRGIGRKGAERMILELKDKLKGAELPEELGPDSQRLSDDSTPRSEAVNALMVLGYSAAQSTQAVAAVFTPDCGLEELIKLALRQLVR
ncbi:MAG: Holliday junction branch migration protein RuvA [Saccharofermentanales bacterium]